MWQVKIEKKIKIFHENSLANTLKILKSLSIIKTCILKVEIPDKISQTQSLANLKIIKYEFAEICVN
jgi:hypothetical protein